MAINVTLSENEIRVAATEGTSRKLASDRRRANGAAPRRAEHYIEPVTWDQEIESACAELAVCRWRNSYWFGSNFKPGDPGTDAGDAQARWTKHQDNGHLLLYPEDHDEQYFVLVVGRSQTMQIVGYLLAKEGKRDDCWREPPRVKAAAWWVSQDQLHRV